RNRFRKHIDPMPASKRAGKSDDGGRVTAAQFLTQTLPLQIRRWSIRDGIDSIRIDQNFRFRDAAGDQVVPNRLGYHRNCGSLVKSRRLSLQVHSLEAESVASKAARHLYLRSVVFHDVRNAKFLA